MHQQKTSADETAKALASLSGLEEIATTEDTRSRGSDDPAVVARWMLGVLEQISAYDDQAVSHLVTGFLKHACGQRLLSVEKTAMHISGLAHRVGERFSLSEEGSTLLNFLTIAPVPSVQQEPAEVEALLAEPGERKPFAKLNFGTRTFEIADGDGDGELVFRPNSADEHWVKLRNGRQNGWDVIGAEILKQSMDVFANYVNLHSIRLDDLQAGQGAHVFEIDKIRWWVRVNGTHAEFTTDLKANWIKIPSSIQETSIRALGIAAAQELIPDFRKRLEPDADAWILRMAHAAAITPIM